jgi:F0F1-type ATP synthase membrane subunit b/b'
MKYIFYGLLIYVLYKLIFDFIIPFSKATRQIKSKIREAQERQQQFDRQQNAAEQVKREPPRSASEDYIEFEEVK